MPAGNSVSEKLNASPRDAAVTLDRRPAPAPAGE
jgi:hypothetical protein